jgi:hypothetical protein
MIVTAASGASPDSQELSVAVGDIVTVHGMSSTRSHKLFCTNAFGEQGYVSARVVEPIELTIDTNSHVVLVMSTPDHRVCVDANGHVSGPRSSGTRATAPLPLSFTATPATIDDAKLRSEPSMIVSMISPVFRVSSGHVVWFARPRADVGAELRAGQSVLLECVLSVTLNDASLDSPPEPHPVGRQVHHVIGSLHLPSGECPPTFSFRMPDALFPSIFARPLPNNDKRLRSVLFTSHTSMFASIVDDATQERVVDRQLVGTLIVPGPRNKPKTRVCDAVAFSRFSLLGKQKFHINATVERLVPGRACPITFTLRSAQGDHTVSLTGLMVELSWTHSIHSVARGTRSHTQVVAFAYLGAPDLAATEGTTQHVLNWNVPFFDISSCHNVTISDVTLSSTFALRFTFDVGVVGTKVEFVVPDVVVDVNDNDAALDVQHQQQPPAEVMARLSGGNAGAARSLTREERVVAKLAAAAECNRCSYQVLTGAPSRVQCACVYGEDHAAEWRRFTEAGGVPLPMAPAPALSSGDRSLSSGNRSDKSDSSLQRQRSTPAMQAQAFDELDKDKVPALIMQAIQLELDVRPCDECNYDIKNSRLNLAQQRCEFGAAHEDAHHRLLWIKDVAVRAATEQPESIDALWTLPEERSTRISELKRLRDAPKCDACRFAPSTGKFGVCSRTDSHRATLAKFQHLRLAISSMPLTVHTDAGDLRLELRPAATVSEICAQLSAETNRVVRQFGVDGIVEQADSKRDALSMSEAAIEARFGDYVPVPRDEVVDCSRCQRPNSADVLFCRHCKTLLPEHMLKSRFAEPTASETPLDDCNVCASPLTTGAIVTTLPCMHVFHHKCICQWLHVHSECPVCKLEVTQENLSLP